MIQSVRIKISSKNGEEMQEFAIITRILRREVESSR